MAIPGTFVEIFQSGSVTDSVANTAAKKNVYFLVSYLVPFLLFQCLTTLMAPNPLFENHYRTLKGADLTRNSVMMLTSVCAEAKEKLIDAKTKKLRISFNNSLLLLWSVSPLCVSFSSSSPPPYRWSQAAFNNPMHSHASTPQATPLMLHYSHTHIHRDSASSQGRTPVFLAQIGSAWSSDTGP